uniref:Uncharacterized protein n=1 Tax=Klebsiella pneumoniae TaxID=573 RepID=A0A2L1KAS4_KLEPN|nr:Hypothetical protein [Klebsiella pneumoniae]AVE19174.1 Hypothetical protein [Klebsiella pneumoniae]AVE19497.1 Hypothetical protein [Klebsiella pneumoniae]UUW42049.1 hypothetical protein [Klebsiella michiganensis]
MSHRIEAITWLSCCRCLVSWPPGRAAACNRGGLVSPHRGDHLVELLIYFWRPDLNLATAITNTTSCAPAADRGHHI